eukprot:3548410-Alexandrium_andersonii.AAC.1
MLGTRVVARSAQACSARASCTPSARVAEYARVGPRAVNLLADSMPRVFPKCTRACQVHAGFCVLRMCVL